jgi:transposase InsO family protein
VGLLFHTGDVSALPIGATTPNRITAPAVFHSDQGSEYQSQLLRAVLLAHHILPSHSKKSHPWENGYQESFYRSFKQELGDTSQLLTIDELYEAIAQRIYYYNTARIHSALKMPPRIYFAHWQAQQHTSSNVIHSV